MNENFKKKPVGRMIKQINEMIESSTNELSARQDLTSSQVHVLAFLHQKASKCAERKEIEDFLGCSQPTVTGLIQRMTKKGLIEVIDNPESKRVSLIHITEVGCSKWEAGFQYMQSVEEKILSPLNKDQQVLFTELLEKIIEGSVSSKSENSVQL